jgi:hypothetical protein
MRTPTVVAALTVGGEGATEVGCGEAYDTIYQTWVAGLRSELSDGGLEGVDRFAEFVEQIGLGTEACIARVRGVSKLRGMGVITADRDKEDLPFYLE